MKTKNWRNDEAVLLGDSPEMRRLRWMVEKAAQSPNARVLVVGESGTGKENVARGIHEKSIRGAKPFLAFNCACSLNKELVESRLFGYRKGAFTGATENAPGIFELAGGGDVFLDEVGELQHETQAILLRALETGAFSRVGDSRTIPLQARIIAGTNKNLVCAVESGDFRCDLYQRLSICPILTPPLRAHMEDVPLLASDWWRRHTGAELTKRQLSDLASYDYRGGNVRELFNLLERATIFAETDLETDFAALIKWHLENDAIVIRELGRGADGTSEPEALKDVILSHVRKIYSRYGGNACRTASALGIARNTLRKYLDG